MIELSDVCFRWPQAEPCLKNLSLHVAAGEKIVLLGANGSGKSTLLKLMNGLIFPDSGELRWKGELLSKAHMKQRDFSRSFRRENVLLFQHPESMLFNPTVRDEIAYGLRQLDALDGPNIQICVEYWADQLGLSAVIEQAPFNLSGGQKQKVALACLMVLNPHVLLLDEPSASLDPATVGWLVDTLIHSDKTIITSTHNLSIAMELGTRGIVMGKNSVLYDGPLNAALADIELLERAGLAHRHRHRHGSGTIHSHAHVHDWSAR